MPMPDEPDALARFVAAQDGVYDRALAELRAGRKTSHWMWFVFPQLAGLGRSETARFFAIRDRAEAERYFAHPLLGERLSCATEAALSHARHATAETIFGGTDATKFRSCCTLFGEIAPPDAPFGRAIEGFFGGRPDERTLALLTSA